MELYDYKQLDDNDGLSLWKSGRNAYQKDNSLPDLANLANYIGQHTLQFQRLRDNIRYTLGRCLSGDLFDLTQVYIEEKSGESLRHVSGSLNCRDRVFLLHKLAKDLLKIDGEIKIKRGIHYYFDAGDKGVVDFGMLRKVPNYYFSDRSEFIQFYTKLKKDLPREFQKKLSGSLGFTTE